MTKITSSMIFEVMGRPPEYITQVISDLIAKIEKEEGVKVIEKQIHEPKKLEDKEIFTNFAEIDIETDTLVRLLRIIFSYMPSHIEVITPENLTLSNMNLNEVFNELVLRLHKYDEIAKRAIIENQMLQKKLQEIAGQSAGSSSMQMNTPVLKDEGKGKKKSGKGKVGKKKGKKK